MQNYVVDPATGFLTPGPLNPNDGFTAKQKETFLAAFKKTANISACAKMVGIERGTVHNHLERDPMFYKAYRDAIEALCDEREAAIYKTGKFNPTAAIMFLKAYRPHIWNEKRLVEHSGAPSGHLKGLLEELKKDGKLIDVKEEPLDK